MTTSKVKPAYRSTPQAHDRERAREAIDLAKSVGLELDRAQRGLLYDSLGRDKRGDWVSSEVVNVQPRQNGKTASCEARVLAGLALWGEPSMTWTAHRFTTALESFERLCAYIDGSDELTKQVKKIYRSALNTSIVMRNGAKVRFLARATSMGRGFSSATLILDEALVLNETQIASLLPTRSAVSNGQIWYLSSAPQVDSYVLKRLMMRGRAGDAPRMTYVEYCAPDGADIRDRMAWRAANPAYGERITDEAIEAELAVMSEWDFAIERLGIVELSERREVGPIDLTAWGQSSDPYSQLVDPVTFGVDVAPDGSSSCIAVAGRREDGLLHVEIVDQRPGTAWVVDRLVTLFQQQRPSAVVLDPGSRAGALEMPLAAAGFGRGQAYPMELVTARELAQASVSLTDDVNDGRVRHLGDDRLTAAVSGARTRPLCGSWTWDRRASTADVSPLVAITLARHGHALAAIEDTFIEPYVGAF